MNGTKCKRYLERSNIKISLDRPGPGVCNDLGIKILFTQRQVRAHTGWSDYQVKAHLRKLVSLEYVLVHHGGRGQRFVYEFLYSGQGKDGHRFLMGLIDVAKLKGKYDADREHVNSKREVSGSIQGAAGEHGGSKGKNKDQLYAGGYLDSSIG